MMGKPHVKFCHYCIALHCKDFSLQDCVWLCCVHPGSGKSFSMMGNGEQPGLIPRLCCSLFERVHREENEAHTFKVEVSYMEIYNEKVRDLLDPKGWVWFVRF